VSVAQLVADEYRTSWIKDRSPDPDPARVMDFYLGTHMPRWMEESPVPLFISQRTLNKYKRDGDPFPKAQCLVAIDSGGFTELQKYGAWTMSEDEYGGMIARFMDNGVTPQWVAPQDWMCEPAVIHGGTWNGNTFAGTGLSVPIHQELTIANFLYLRENFDFVPWIPVLQGWTMDDYLSHVEQYAAAGVDLAAEHRVGLGSVCRRQSTDEIGAITGTLAAKGFKLHGFGVKTAGLAQYAHNLASADSLAWSGAARWTKDHPQGIRLDGCEHRGACNNCLRFAVRWREKVLEAVRAEKQYALDLFA
jgi:hypothetical protein